MKCRLALSLAAIAMLIAAVAPGEATPDRLQNMRTRFRTMVSQPPAYATASAASSASGSGSEAASVTHSGGASGFPAPRFGSPSRRQPAGSFQQSVQQPRYAPASAAYHGASGAEASTSSHGGAAASAASAFAGAAPANYNRQPRARRFQAPQPPQFHPQEPKEESFYPPEVAHQYQPEPVAHPQPRFRAPAVRVHPAVPRVPASNFGRGRFGAANSVSTSAAAGAGGAAAMSAAHNGAGFSQQAASAVTGHGKAGSVAASQAGASSSAAAAQASSSSAPASYDAHEVAQEHTSEHYSEPETVSEYGAQSGGYANNGNGLVTSSYVRSTDSEETHEDGKEDSDHYYNAGSYGKTYDENNRESYDNDDEDVLHTNNLYRSKKSKTAYQKEGTKTRRESGSRVLAKDRHSAAYNLDKKRFKENVDQHYHKEGEGVLESGHQSEASDFDEESEEARDNRGLGTFVGVDGTVQPKRPAFNPAAAAAASASSAGVTSSSSAGRR